MLSNGCVTRWILAISVLILVGTELLWAAKWAQHQHDHHNELSSFLPLKPSVWKLPIPSNSAEIRTWGCNRTETPLIFVHIGKSGGGSVRARIEASSLNYTKDEPEESLDDSYYPLHDKAKARYVSSCFARHLPGYETTFEGTLPCHASTPIGQAFCPGRMADEMSDEDYEYCEASQHGECNLDSNTCHLVYAGHNFIGSELHWLPLGYLA